MDGLKFDQINNDFKTFLRDTGGQIHRLLQDRNARTRTRFIEHIKQFMSMFETSGVELSKLKERAEKLGKEIEAPDNLTPDPVMWYRIPAHTSYNKGGFHKDEVIFPRGYQQREPTEAERLMLCYVKLAVIYDLVYARTLGTAKLYFDVDRTENNSSEWSIPETVAYGIWSRMTEYGTKSSFPQEANAIEEKYIQNALEMVKADLAREQEEDEEGVLATMEVQWDEGDSSFWLSSEARVKVTANQMSKSWFAKHVTNQTKFHYMRRYAASGRPLRTKVHIGEFMRFCEEEKFIPDNADHKAQIEAMRRTIAQQDQQIERNKGYMK